MVSLPSSTTAAVTNSTQQPTSPSLNPFKDYPSPVGSLPRTTTQLCTRSAPAPSKPSPFTDSFLLAHCTPSLCCGNQMTSLSAASSCSLRHSRHCGAVSHPPLLTASSPSCCMAQSTTLSPSTPFRFPGESCSPPTATSSSFSPVRSLLLGDITYQELRASYHLMPPFLREQSSPPTAMAGLQQTKCRSFASTCSLLPTGVLGPHLHRIPGESLWTPVHLARGNYTPSHIGWEPLVRIRG